MTQLTPFCNHSFRIFDQIETAGILLIVHVLILSNKSSWLILSISSSCFVSFSSDDLTDDSVVVGLGCGAMGMTLGGRLSKTIGVDAVYGTLFNFILSFTLH